jgi:hypothetical protein
MQENFVYHIIVERPEETTLSYPLNKILSLGIDPRNEIVLVGHNILAKHLSIKLINSTPVLINHGNEGDLQFNGHFIPKNSSTIIDIDDVIEIDGHKIYLKYEIVSRPLNDLAKNPDPLVQSENCNRLGLLEIEKKTPIKILNQIRVNLLG